MSDLAALVRAGLAARADPEAAPGMQRYMKSEMPFRGVPRPAGPRCYASCALCWADPPR